jgi:hypothetical protein
MLVYSGSESLCVQLLFEVSYVELEFPMLPEVVDHSPNYSYRNSPNYGIRLFLRLFLFVRACFCLLRIVPSWVLVLVYGGDLGHLSKGLLMAVGDYVVRSV